MDALDTRRVRAAHTQSLFREVNERIATLVREYRDEERPVDYICECLDTGCTETVELSQSEYERLRERGTRFFVLPGHEDGAVEVTVAETAQYLIVEKLGAGGEVAETMNPRNRGAA